MIYKEIDAMIIKNIRELCKDIQAFSLSADKEVSEQWYNTIANDFLLYNIARNEEGIEVCARLAKQDKLDEALNLFNLIVGEN